MPEIETSPTSSDGTAGTAITSGIPLSNGQAHLKQKRARSQLSCQPCRVGKLKCNRQHPACDQCTKRSREAACVYVPPPAKRKPTQNVRGRIKQLENLVVDLMQNQQVQLQANGATSRGIDAGFNTGTALPQSQPTPPSDTDTSPSTSNATRQSQGSPEDVDSATTPFGQMKISKNEISYVGESHWGAILDSISDLKREIGEDEEDDDDAPTIPAPSMNAWGSIGLGAGEILASNGLGFMLGVGDRPVTREELISSLPEKKVVDRLLSLWFNSPDPFKPIIHAPTFQDEYKRFLRNPRDTPTMWLGLLYGILSLAASFALRDIDPHSANAQSILAEVNKYHGLAAAAAVLADFTKPKAYTLECLMLYAAGLRSNNAFVNVWLMIGLVCRLALRMGYHRDPSHYPAISVFQGEMRRRVWAVIGMIDVLISFQLGLPSMFRTITSDTQPPHNLLDRDFNTSTKVLPPSRGIDEVTPSSYTIAKLRIVRIFADAAELGHQTVAPVYAEVMRLDRELEEAKAAVPPLLQMPDISEVITDPAEQLMCRFNLSLLALKTKIVLHRRYMRIPLEQLSLREQQQGVGDSRKACIESALQVLRHHHTIYSATQPGGQLESVKWYMGSISTHDFLLAAMVICLELNEQLHNRSNNWSPSGLQCPKRPLMMEALEKSQQIWSDTSKKTSKHLSLTTADGTCIETGEHMFDETEKASRAMAVMLAKVKRQMRDTPEPDASASSLPPVAAAPPPDFPEISSYAYTEADAFAQTPFRGVVSGHDWNMDGVPDMDWRMPDGSAVAQSSLTSNGAVGNGQQLPTSFDQADFAMTSEMLEGQPLDIDWDGWDQEINKGPQFSMDDWRDVDMAGVFSAFPKDSSLGQGFDTMSSGFTGNVSPAEMSGSGAAQDMGWPSVTTNVVNGG